MQQAEETRGARAQTEGQYRAVAISLARRTHADGLSDEATRRLREITAAPVDQAALTISIDRVFQLRNSILGPRQTPVCASDIDLGYLLYQQTTP